MNMPRATKKINNLSEDSKLTVNYALGFTLQRPKETALCNSRSRKRLQMTTVGFFVKGLLLSPEISMWCATIRSKVTNKTLKPHHLHTKGLSQALLDSDSP